MAGYEIKPVTAIVTEENISVLGCVKFFESGFDNIYLVDGKGRYPKIPELFCPTPRTQ